MRPLLLLICLSAIGGLFAQALPDAVTDPRIASVQLAPSTNWYGFPVLHLGDTGTLTLSFDELVGVEAPQSNFTVSLIPCDLHWQPARVLPVECYTGFSQLSLRDYTPSGRPRIPYRHYSLRFPEEGQQMKRSGNFVLQVFRDGDDAQPVLQRRFVVCERSAPFSVQSPAIARNRMPLRTLSLLVNAGSLGVSDQLPYASLLLLRNYRWQDAVLLQPTYVLGQNQWRYDLTLSTLFPAGGQVFRQFNTSRTTIQLQQVAGWMPGDTLTALLKKDFPAPLRQPKLLLQDLNGGWEPLNEDLLNLDSEVETEYVQVRFIFESQRLPEPVQVVGRFCAWQGSEATTLHYDEALAAYTGKLLLKQGIYDYAIQTGPEGDLAPAEGMAAEGENEYLGLLYFLPPGERCHRLVGIWGINHL